MYFFWKQKLEITTTSMCYPQNRSADNTSICVVRALKKSEAKVT